MEGIQIRVSWSTPTPVDLKKYIRKVSQASEELKEYRGTLLLYLKVSLD